MFDPMTVAFEIKFLGVTIWHKDPCKDGTDNSCDWHGWKRKLNKKEKAITEKIYHLETILDNRPFFPDHSAHLRFQELKETIYDWKKRSKFRLPVRWHIWHWRIQVRAWQKFYRWAFESCAICKKGFAWGESVIGNWDGDRIWHHSCERYNYKQPAPANEKGVVE